MNFIQTIVTIFGVTATISGIGSTVAAQSPQIEQAQTRTPIQKPGFLGKNADISLLSSGETRFLGILNQLPSSPTQQEIAPATISQLDSTVDLTLLANTVRNFLTSETYQTQSAMEINMTASGLSLTFLVEIDTITQSPDKFRSEITFLPSFQSPETIKYTVVADGEQVWIYRPDLEQYAVTNSEAFSEMFLIGFSSLIFLEFSTSIRESFPEAEINNENIVNLVEIFLKSNDFQSDAPHLSGGRQIFQDKEYYRYEYRVPEEELLFNAFVDPETATLEQLQFTVEDEGINFVFTEQIIQRIAEPLITADTFSFSPPPGATMVDSLSIDPF